MKKKCRKYLLGLKDHIYIYISLPTCKIDGHGEVELGPAGDEVEERELSLKRDLFRDKII